MDIKERIDIASELVKKILTFKDLSPFLGVLIDNNQINIDFQWDLRLALISIDLENNKIVFRTPSVEIPDIIMEIYDDVDYEKLRIGEWREEMLREIIDKYPRAFSEYIISKEIAEEIRKKYGVDIYVEIDEYGHYYTELVYPIEQPTLKYISDKVIEGITILLEYREVDSKYVETFNREIAEENMSHFLEVAKAIIRIAIESNIDINFIDIATSPYEEPTLKVDFKSTNGETIIHITKHRKGYEISIAFQNTNIRKKLIEIGQFEETDEYILKLKTPLKTYTDLVKWLQYNLKYIVL